MTPESPSVPSVPSARFDSAHFDWGLEYAALSHVGRVRTNNEDVWRADTKVPLFAIADGMGGHEAGEVAAMRCLDAFFAEMRGDEALRTTRAFVSAPSLEGRKGIFALLRRAALRANEVVRTEAKRVASQHGMGSTLDAVLLAADRAFVLHVGDSRVYLSRASATIQLTHDHDLRAVLAAEGRMGPSQRAAMHNQLLNAIGLSSALASDCTLVEVTEGDRIVLCTDGVHEMIGDESLVLTYVKTGRPADAARALIDAALARGGRDNATALIIEIGAPLRPRKVTPGASHDLAAARASPLLCDLPEALVLDALTMAAEVEIDAGKTIPRIVTTDHVAYIVLDGEAERGGVTMASSALLYAESLVGRDGAPRGGACFKAKSAVRALRLRADDFREVCASDGRLAAALYERLARHLASSAR
jgi:serine/threonine protein phosphatase PrpC